MSDADRIARLRAVATERIGVCRDLEQRAMLAQSERERLAGPQRVTTGTIPSVVVEAVVERQTWQRVLAILGDKPARARR